MNKLKKFIQEKWWVILIAIFVLNVISRSSNTSTTPSSVGNTSTKYSCPECGGPMPNDAGYIEYQGYIQEYPVTPGNNAITCKACALRKKQDYNNGLRSQ